VPALSADEFAHAFKLLANKHGIRIVKRGGKVYCLDVQLAAKPRGNDLTVANAISALSAVNADVLKAADDATLEELRELADRCLTLIADEEERRSLKENAEERRSVLQEAITFCAAYPNLQSRLKEILENDLMAMAHDERVSRPPPLDPWLKGGKT
jgi:hypothetical protein